MIGHQWSLSRYLSQLFPVLVVLLILFVPSYYRALTKPTPHRLSRFYRTLEPYQEVIRAPGTVLLTSRYSSELCNYIGLRNCKGVFYYDLRSEVRADTDWPAILEKHGVNLFYADENVLFDPGGPKFVSDAKAYGWETLAYQNAAGQKWMLLRKVRQEVHR